MNQHGGNRGIYLEEQVTVTQCVAQKLQNDHKKQLYLFPFIKIHLQGDLFPLKKKKVSWFLGWYPSTQVNFESSCEKINLASSQVQAGLHPVSQGRNYEKLLIRS